MAEAIVSIVLGQLTPFTVQKIKSEVSLIWGARKAVENLPGTLRTIKAVLTDAEQKQVKEEAVKVWLDELKEAAYDMDDVIDEWNTSILKLQIEIDENASTLKKKVCFFFPSTGFSFRQVVFRHRIAFKIKDINERLETIAKKKDMYRLKEITSSEQPQRVKTTSFIDVSKIYGRDEEKKTLARKLLSTSSNQEKHLPIISIMGKGGTGKTCLAQFAYNHEEVINNFDTRMWVCVSDPFDELKVAKAIVEALKSACFYLGELQNILKHINELIEGKTFLLVLDNVWIEDYNKWEPLYNCLKNGRSGSKILITTRKQTVAHMMNSIDIVTINELQEDECWSFFKSLALFDKSSEDFEKLEGIGRKIVGKCKGLPLAVKIIGSLLSFKKTIEEWQNILESEIWKLEKLEKDLFPILLLSYNDLSFMVKRCFSNLAIFPKDYNLKKDQLIQMWMAQGYLSLEENKEMEIIGQEYFDNLTMRSLFQDFKKDDNDDNIIECKMHDIVYDFIQFLTKNECFAIVGAHHPMFMVNKEILLSIKSISYIKKLRSLLVDRLDFSESNILFSNIFCELTHLRALDIQRRVCSESIDKIPKKIKNLIHLRYLNLYRNDSLTELPEELCELYNLQTLDISECETFQTLPKKIKNLINLRYLINHDTPMLNYIPKGIERLSGLRVLNNLVMGDSFGQKEEGCSLGCLEHLNNLRSLGISRLDTVTDASEAKRAQLKNKQNLLSLDLYFLSPWRGENDKVVLEALEAPPNLEKLKIYEYGGETLSPNWMMLFTKLRVLTLFYFVNMKPLPPLGKLSFLESLYIDGPRELKRVGNESLGIESDDTSTIAFPKLKSLKFTDMRSWEEWDYETTNKGGENIKILPCLRFLEIGSCEELKTLPETLLRSTTLEKLQIYDCRTLEQRCSQETGDYWPKISHIPHIQFRE